MSRALVVYGGVTFAPAVLKDKGIGDGGGGDGGAVTPTTIPYPLILEARRDAVKAVQSQLNSKVYLLLLACYYACFLLEWLGYAYLFS
ncbi:hypothetical protein [Ktedonobacter robiniae]|uniref:Uncharacterized protein n=1 Tax=Ktedonobacter robiniae TaxID=2778365 RepID=A0ABQ3UXJ4_9CHLR|nr:hypothetical protein [Ktedonobacter robiniae]GHO57405.1 hypothetical protein KSB_58800 [Ktedonobacter robiniae]